VNEVVKTNEKTQNKNLRGEENGAHRTDVMEHHEQPKVVITVQNHLEIDCTPHPRGRVLLEEALLQQS
jgi:hypothetical protein